MKKIGAILFLAGLVSAAGAQTNTPASRTMSLQDCVAEALKHNFDVRVERYQPLIARLGLDEAYAGYDPSFSFQGTHSHNNAGGQDGTNGVVLTENNSFSSGLGGTLPSGATYNLFGNVGDSYVPAPEYSSGQAGVNFTQPLLQNLWIDSTRLGISAAKNQVKYTAQGLRQQLITTISAVENAYYELIYARENLKVAEEALNEAQTQLDEDQQRVQIGTIAERAGTLEQDEAQVAQDKANLISAQYTLEADQNALKNLITDNYLQWHDQDITPAESLVAVQQVFDVQFSWTKGLAARPDLLQAKLNLEQQGIQLKYDWNQIFPQVNLQATYGYNGAGSGYGDTFGEVQAGNRPFYDIGGEIIMPLSNLKARSTYKSDKAVEQQDLLKLKQTEQNVMVQIDNAVKQAQSYWESVGATKQARIYAEAALDAEEKKYAVGKSTTFTVLQLQNNLTAARGQEIRALANYQEGLTALAQQEGSTLERRNVEVTGH
jgi:outer membrane protein TolC